jgi:hypothetical protein
MSAPGSALRSTSRAEASRTTGVGLTLRLPATVCDELLGQASPGRDVPSHERLGASGGLARREDSDLAVVQQEDQVVAGRHVQRTPVCPGKDEPAT